MKETRIEFRCRYHGRAYSIDGSLVSTPCELDGVPQYAQAYGRMFDKSASGLVRCPQVANYRGLIFATWDPEAPSFEEYVGDFDYWLDNLADGSDGTVGGVAVFGGVHKWGVKANCKFASENFIGDMYHAQSITRRWSRSGSVRADSGPHAVGMRSTTCKRGCETSFLRAGTRRLRLRRPSNDNDESSPTWRMQSAP